MKVKLEDKVLIEVRELKSKADGSQFRLMRVGCAENFTNLTLFLSDNVETDHLISRDKIDLDIILSQKGNQLRANVIGVEQKVEV